MLLVLWLSQERETVHVEATTEKNKYKEIDKLLTTSIREITRTNSWFTY
jgi:hypothetical protein